MLATVGVAVLLVAGFVAAATAVGRDPVSGKGCHGQGRRVCTTTSTTTTPTGSGPCGTSVGKQPATYQHVVWIVFENKSYSEIIGDSAAPYLNSLAAKCGLATNYLAVSHPSLPNYIALTSGGTQGITDDNPPSAHALGVASIFSQLSSGWNAKNESMRTNCQLSDSSPYAVRHNPAVYYTNIRTTCSLQDTPGGISANTRFTFVTPNLCNDMHDCSVSTGDQWLAANLPGLLSSSTYAAGGTAIFVTWDEDDGSASNHVATLIISPYTPVGARSAAAFNHYGLLATTQSMLGLGCLGSACSAGSMRGAFGL
jgi:hypothetical protein